MINRKRAEQILMQLREWNVDSICLCAGGRNAPFVEALIDTDFKVYTFFDERAASFFALGRSKSTNKACAVITTSGTAVAELLPACIEAYYSHLPVVFISGDRPEILRGTNAPQTIEQSIILQDYARVYDIMAHQEVPRIQWNQIGPLHINICFDEPLIETVQAIHFDACPLVQENEKVIGLKNAQEFVLKHRKPLVILGKIPKTDKKTVKELLLYWQRPLYIEAASGLREDSDLQELAFKAGDFYLSHSSFYQEWDSILRIGDVPTCGFWRLLDLKKVELPVLHITNKKFLGMRYGELLYGNISNVLRDLNANFSSVSESFALQQNNLHAQLQKLFESHPESEPAWIYKISTQISHHDHIYLGNSMPIRTWDLAAQTNTSFSSVESNRGANGIDGQLSTFYGFAKDISWAVLGDLTLLYDSNAPWILHQINAKTRVVCINNFGGRIFERKFKKDLYKNIHSIEFESWSKMWKLEYYKNPSHFQFDQDHCFIEIQPDLKQTKDFYDEYEEMKL